MKLLKLSIITIIFGGFSFGGNVNITPEISHIEVDYLGQKIKINRVQNTLNRLHNSYTKTSRECPPFCIQKSKVHKEVETYEELEVLKFMDKQKGVVVDVRDVKSYSKGTIPGSLNLPNVLITGDMKDAYFKKILTVLGATETKGVWDFSNVTTLMIFDEGPWANHSGKVIMTLIKVGYPPKNLFYYRGGMQGWELFGLTTVLPS